MRSEGTREIYFNAEKKEEIRRPSLKFKRGLFVAVYIAGPKIPFCFLKQNKNRRHGINQRLLHLLTAKTSQ